MVSSLPMPSTATHMARRDIYAVLLSSCVLFTDSTLLPPALSDMLIFVILGILTVSLQQWSYKNWLCILLAFSSLVSPSVGFLAMIPGGNVINICFFLFVIFWLGHRKDCGETRMHPYLTRGILVLLGLLFWRMCCTLRVYPPNIIPESFGILRNLLIFICAYHALSQSLHDSVNRSKLEILGDIFIPLGVVIVVHCALLQNMAADIEFKYNFEVKTDSVNYNSIRNSMGRGAAGVGRIAGLGVLFCLSLIIYQKGWKFLKYIGIVLCGYCLLLSFSKTTQLGVVLSFLGVALLKGNLQSLVKFLIAAVCGIWFIHGYFFVRIRQMYDDTSLIVGGEYSRYDMAFSPFQQMNWTDYLWGLGTMGYLETFGGRSLYKAHNGISELVLEGGIPNVILYLLLWGYSGWVIYKTLRCLSAESGEKNFMLFFPLQIWLFMLICFCNGGSFITSGSGAVFMLTWGIFSACMDRIIFAEPSVNSLNRRICNDPIQKRPA